MRGYLRQWVGRHAALEGQIGLASCIATPLALSEQVSLNDPLVGRGVRRDAVFSFVLRLHPESAHKRVDQSTAEVNPDYGSELTDRIRLTCIDAR